MLDSEAQLLKQSPKLIACVFSNGVSILINFNALLLSTLWLKVIAGICCCVLSVCPDVMVRVYVPAAAYVWLKSSFEERAVPDATVVGGVSSPQSTVSSAGVLPDSGNGILNDRLPLLTSTVSAITAFSSQLIEEFPSIAAVYLIPAA